MILTKNTEMLRENPIPVTLSTINSIYIGMGLNPALHAKLSNGAVHFYDHFTSFLFTIWRRPPDMEDTCKYIE